MEKEKKIDRLIPQKFFGKKITDLDINIFCSTSVNGVTRYPWNIETDETVVYDRVDLQYYEMKISDELPLVGWMFVVNQS